MKRYTPYLLALGLGLLMLPIPLLRDFHFESAFLAATIGALRAGWKAGSPKSRHHLRMGFTILWQTLTFAFPLFVFSLSRNCISWDGVGLWLLMPAPSIFFGISVGRFFRLLRFPVPQFFTLLTLLFVGIGIILIEVFNMPQVYAYNHIWGFWPGPIYDQEITFPVSLIYFRVITFLWIWLMWMLPNWYHTRHQKKRISLVVVLLILSFYFRPELGINTPASYLQKQLNHTKETVHFRLYFDPDLYTDEEMDYWAKRHEFHFKQIVEILDVDWPEGRKIDSYLYAHSWQKKKLVGAKFTSYVPVWLEQDQLHIAQEHLEGVLKHELVHVIAKQFGQKFFNASMSVGLVEGLAEGIAADASDVSTLDQIMAAEQPFPTAKDMRAALTISGFYTSAGSISYTTAGSFVQFLLENYPVENLKTAYKESSFDNAYSVPFDTLVQQWHAQLPIRDIDSLDTETSRMIFSQKSVFQTDCPHTLSPTLKSWDTYNKLERSKDSTAALAQLSSLYAMRPEIRLIKQRWADYQLKLGQPQEVINSFSDDDSVHTFPLIKADALLITGNIVAAQMLYNHTKAVADSSIKTLMESLEVRSTPFFWNTFVDLRYKNKLPAPADFEELPNPTKWLSIIRAIEHQKDSTLIEYVRNISPSVSDEDWFGVQLDVIDRLSYIGEYDLANFWIDALLSMDLRARYVERVQEKREWLQFLSSQN